MIIMVAMVMMVLMVEIVVDGDSYGNDGEGDTFNTAIQYILIYDQIDNL